MQRSIDAGLHYLAQQQQQDGSFRVWNSPDPLIRENCQLEQSVFASACILYCLEWLRTSETEGVREKALAFLRAETGARGLSRYYASKSHTQGPMPLPFTIPYDVDTTSCVSLMLQRYGPTPDNKDILLANRDESGRFRTWLMQEPIPEAQSGFPFVCVRPTENSVCAGVNANALCYLGESEATIAATQFLVESLCRGTHLQDSGYYADEMVLFYFVSRAYFEGVSSLGTVRPALMERLMKHQKSDASFGTPLQTAMALCALKNFGAAWSGQEAALQSLVAGQNHDGSWVRSSFYVGDPEKVAMKEYLHMGEHQRELTPAALAASVKHFGSEEIATAYCLEALSRCGMVA